MNSSIYNDLNKAWKSTCRILLGEEVGELKEYQEWLTALFCQIGKRKSHTSGKDVTLAVDDYSDTSKFISLGEEKDEAIDPLSINEIKDIDSIAGAISEKWAYTGNRVLGNSAFVEFSDLVTDSQYISNCANIQNVQYAFSLYEAQYSKYVFGSGQLSEGEFLIGFFSGVNNKRCFNSSDNTNSSDLYLSHNCHGCHDLMFSFHQLNKRNCIGNLELPKEKYAELKKKLLGEIAGELKERRRFPHVYQLVPEKELSSEVRITAPPAENEGDISQIEKAFTSTFKVIFKKDTKGMDQYDEWLSKHIASMYDVESPFGSKVYFANYPNYPILTIMPRKRLVNYTEALELGKIHIDENKVSELGKLRDWVAGTGCFCADFSSGRNTNVMKSAILMDSSNIYKSYVGIKTEYAGINSWPLRSKYLFGCNHIVDSQFSIKCYNSSHLNRCFEIDASARCAGAAFSHNCEGLNDAMFCFNTKGKRYAIGNAQLPPDKFMSLKDSLMEQVADEIIKAKSLKLDIYNIGRSKSR